MMTVVSYNVSTAKTQLGEIRRAALEGREIVITNTKTKGNSESVTVIASWLLNSLLDRGYTFSPEWIREEGDANYTLILPEVDVFGVGATKEAAIQSLIDTLAEYATLFFADLKFYLSPSANREKHYGYLRRIAGCNGDRDRIKSVLGL